MAQNFKIGKVYNFNYKRNTKAVYAEEHVKAELTDAERVKLIKEINDSAEDIKLRFIERKVLLTHYIAYVRRLDMMKTKRELLGGRKTPHEKELEAIIKKYKLLYWPKHKSTTRQKARGLFMRNYDLENIELTNSGRIRAIYAGKVFMKNCNVMHKWYVLSATKVPASRYDEVKNFVNLIF